MIFKVEDIYLVRVLTGEPSRTLHTKKTGPVSLLLQLY